MIRVCQPQPLDSPTVGTLSRDSSLKFSPALAAAAREAAVAAAGNSGGRSGGEDHSSLVKAAAAEAAAAAAAFPLPRALRLLAEALSSEIVIAARVAEACSPRGILRAIAIALAVEAAEPLQSARGGGGDGERAAEGRAGCVGDSLKEERETALLAAAERIRYIARRVEGSGRGNTPSSGGGTKEKDKRKGQGGRGRTAPSHGGDVESAGESENPLFSESAGGKGWSKSGGGGHGEDDRADGEGRGAVDARAEAFRKELVARTHQCGGLKALAVNWDGVARLKEAFVAWVDEVSFCCSAAAPSAGRQHEHYS